MVAEPVETISNSMGADEADYDARTDALLLLEKQHLAEEWEMCQNDHSIRLSLVLSLPEISCHPASVTAVHNIRITLLSPTAPDSPLNFSFSTSDLL
jgi:hypothetical protein